MNNDEYYFFYTGKNLATPTSSDQIRLFRGGYDCQLVSAYSSGKWRSQDTYNFPHGNADFIAYDYVGISSSIGIRNSYTGNNIKQFQAEDYPELCNIPAENGVYTGFSWFFAIIIFLAVFALLINYFKKRV